MTTMNKKYYDPEIGGFWVHFVLPVSRDKVCQVTIESITNSLCGGPFCVIQKKNYRADWLSQTFSKLSHNFLVNPSTSHSPPSDYPLLPLTLFFPSPSPPPPHLHSPQEYVF